MIEIRDALIYLDRDWSLVDVQLSFCQVITNGFQIGSNLIPRNCIFYGSASKVPK